MSTTNPYRIIAIESSPYAVKVRAVMRYRHIPYVWVSRMPQYFAETADVKPLLMPVVQFPNGEYRTDSTPIIRDIDPLHAQDRCIVPNDPAQAFLSDLIEDFADEWLTKCLFNYRFSQSVDSYSGARWVMDDAHADIETAKLRSLTDAFIERQVSRMPLVGCTPANTPALDASYVEVLDIMERFAASDRFLFGTRPALADFGLYGQLHTLGQDPTPMTIMRERAPRTWHWTLRLGDASGVNGDWHQSLASTAVTELLTLIGRYYLPYLRANAIAIDAGENNFEVALAGYSYRQPVFRYQRKCFDYLCRRWQALAAHEELRSLLTKTGCVVALE